MTTSGVPTEDRSTTEFAEGLTGINLLLIHDFRRRGADRAPCWSSGGETDIAPRKLQRGLPFGPRCC